MRGRAHKGDRSRQWANMFQLGFGGTLTAAQPFITTQFISDVPGATSVGAPRLLRVVGAFNWTYSQSCTFSSCPPLPFIVLGCYPTNINEPANFVDVGGLTTNLDSDKGYYARDIWPIPVEKGTGTDVTPVQAGPWVGSEMKVDWPIHRGRGTSPLEHDRAIRVACGLAGANLTGASELCFTAYLWYLYEIT